MLDVDRIDDSDHAAQHARMRAAVIVPASESGAQKNAELAIRDVPWPEPGVGQVRVRIRACGVNRADLLQLRGAYPAPADAPPDIPGLELAGVIDALGAGVSEWSVGDRVFGIVGGGACAEAVVVHARTLARIPEILDFVQAAAIPEAFVTAYDALVVQAGLKSGESVLVHAVGSGVGTAAVQIAKAVGARAIGTARTESKLANATEYGLSGGIVPKTNPDGSPSFASEVRALTNGKGVDVVLELVGGSYVPESLASLDDRGRLVLVGLLAGTRADVDLGLVLRRRLHVFGTVLRSRPLEEKILAARLLEKNLAPLFVSGALRPVVDRVLPLDEILTAYGDLARGDSFGKIVLQLQ